MLRDAGTIIRSQYNYICGAPGSDYPEGLTLQNTRKGRALPSAPVSTLTFSLWVPARLGSLISRSVKTLVRVSFFALLLNCMWHLRELFIQLITVTLAGIYWVDSVATFPILMPVLVIFMCFPVSRFKFWAILCNLHMWVSFFVLLSVVANFCLVVLASICWTCSTSHGTLSFLVGMRTVTSLPVTVV